jgi:putative ABC transport system ATP-binding protein
MKGRARLQKGQKAPEAVIQVKELRKVYRVGGEQVVALNGIDLSIPAGQVCCVVGTSGSGKSTLLNQLAGLEKPTRGCVLIGGRNISAFSENQLARFRQKNVGFIFQSYNLLPTVNALENVSMPLIFRGVPKLLRERAAKKILAEVGLAARAKHRPSQMSGGQQQRVGIARAFVASPKIIFADEPTGNLDSKTTIEVMRMMIRLVRANRQTLVIVTHDPELAKYADRIVTLIDGEIVSDVPNRSIADMLEEGHIEERDVLNGAHQHREKPRKRFMTGTFRARRRKI